MGRAVRHLAQHLYSCLDRQSSIDFIDRRRKQVTIGTIRSSVEGCYILVTDASLSYELRGNFLPEMVDVKGSIEYFCRRSIGKMNLTEEPTS
jgi:hypothetical protein